MHPAKHVLSKNNAWLFLAAASFLSVLLITGFSFVPSSDQDDESIVSVRNIVDKSNPVLRSRHEAQPQSMLDEKQKSSRKLISDLSGKRLKPSKPLDDSRLNILRKAHPVDLAYIDVANDHKDHPHMGAVDEFGKSGYIHGETFLHQGKAPEFSFPGIWGACRKKDATHKMLTERVYVDLDGHEAAESSGKRRVKIMCTVYSTEANHESIENILQTWGPKCDGFMVASTKTDRRLGALNLLHEGPEEYGNMYQKVRSIWSYVYDNYYEKYDWFHIGGDDMYLIIENLRLYLESEEMMTAQNGGTFLPFGNETEQTPMFLGRRFAYQGDMNDIFNSGGSGYTLNKAALKALVVESFPKFMPHAHTFSEDCIIAKALRRRGIYPYETKDDTGGERYMPFMPGAHYNYRMPADHSKDWYARYSIDIKFGLDHCAAKSVAFHYVKKDAMKRLHAILYHLCTEGRQSIES